MGAGNRLCHLNAPPHILFIVRFKYFPIENSCYCFLFFLCKKKLSVAKKFSIFTSNFNSFIFSLFLICFRISIGSFRNECMFLLEREE